jgi:methionyl-tRNA formyltransferase
VRVIFMGTPDFAVPALDAIVDAGHDVVLVVAQPDRRAGRGKKLRSPPVAVRAKELGLPLSQPRAIKTGRFPARYCGLNADISVVIAYGRILTTQLLTAPQHGCVNVHASLLPRWRGAAPIQAAILHGDEETGVCTQRMEEGLDTGPVYLERRLALTGTETAGDLHDTLAAMSAEVAVATLETIAAAQPTPQEHHRATWAPKIDKSHGRIQWTDTTTRVDRRVRAMTPWPGGWTDFGNGALKLKQVRPVTPDPDPSTPPRPGELLCVSPLVVATADGALELVVVQAPGRKPVSGADFANGMRLKTGDWPWPS